MPGKVLCTNWICRRVNVSVVTEEVNVCFEDIFI